MHYNYKCNNKNGNYMFLITNELLYFIKTFFSFKESYKIIISLNIQVLKICNLNRKRKSL
jgi:hypothetical protein